MNKSRAPQITDAIVSLINKHWLELNISEAYTFEDEGTHTSFCVVDEEHNEYDWTLTGEKQR